MSLTMERVQTYATFLLFQTMMTLEFIVFKFLHSIPFVGDYTTVKWFDWTARIVMKKEEYWNTAFGWEMYKLQTRVVQKGTFKNAKLGRPAPNPEVLLLDGNRDAKKLLDYCKGTRPLVLNFGSCS